MKKMKKIIKLAMLSLCVCLAAALASCDFFDTDEPPEDEAHVHTVIHWEIAEEAGCEKDGRRFGTCIDCLNEVREDIPAYGHRYLVEACARCGGMLSNSEFEFELIPDGSGYVFSGIGSFDGTHLVIPETYNGLPVVMIDQMALGSQNHIESVVIPSSVKDIGFGAFSYCRSLKSVNLPEGLKNIASETFKECTSLESIVIPDSVEIIGSYAFWGCSSLREIEIPGKCNSIHTYAFEDCENLSRVILNEGVAVIWDSAFAGTAVENIDFPSTTSIIGKNAFRGTHLKSLRLTGNIMVNEYAFADCESLETLVYGITNHYNEGYIFYSCDSLREVTFGEWVYSVPQYMLSDCKSLETVMIPSRLTTLGKYCFNGCESLLRIEYEGSVAMWNGITENVGWNLATGSYTVYCNDGEINKLR